MGKVSKSFKKFAQKGHLKAAIQHRKTTQKVRRSRNEAAERGERQLAARGAGCGTPQRLGAAMHAGLWGAAEAQRAAAGAEAPVRPHACSDDRGAAARSLLPPPLPSLPRTAAAAAPLVVCSQPTAGRRRGQ